ncbi:MAG: hypothetical protein ACJAVV_002159 [Alphaproteobacteria bacterium]|jgi:hypothetical protein
MSAFNPRVKIETQDYLNYSGVFASLVCKYIRLYAKNDAMCVISLLLALLKGQFVLIVLDISSNNFGCNEY